MSLVDDINLSKAFKRVDCDRRDDALPDIVGYRDYKKYLSDNISIICERIHVPNQYQTSTPSSIDLPKRGMTLRPGVLPYIDDRLVYQAIVDLLAPHFVPEPSVFSNKLADSTSTNLFLPGVTSWIAFQNKVEELCNLYPFVVETDITAYFDHINHDILMSRISDLFKTVFDQTTLYEIKILLSRLWDKWSLGIRKFGIPQINDASSFMGNLYLDELDKWFSLNRLISLRYVDDIRLFAKSESQARKILADTIVKLREMGLYVSSGKTKIQSCKEAMEQLAKGRDIITQIETYLDTKQRIGIQKACELLRDFFLEIIGDNSKFNDRQFRFCLNRLKRIYGTGIALDLQEKAIEEVLKRFITMPEATDVFVDYLSLFPDHDLIHEKVLDFLESHNNIYSWQEMLLIELLIRANLKSKFKKRANQLAFKISNSKKHQASVSKAYVLLGKNGTYADRRDIRAKYTWEPREYVKRAIIVSIQEMQSKERKNFYEKIASDSRRVKQTVNYVQSLPEPVYFYYKPPNPYQVQIIDNDSDDLFDLGSEYFS